MSDFDTKQLRATFGAYMTGVTVVTARAKDGSLVGFTANSFTSVSMDPPLLLVCPGNHLSSLPVFEQAEHFVVNILSHGQESISNLFASSSEARFDQAAWQADENGCPILENVAASFSCSVHERVTAGDHMILIGRVTRFSKSNDGGLGYCSNGYFSLEKERQADTGTRPGLTGFAGALIQYQDHVLLTVDDDGVRIPTLQIDKYSGARSALAEHFASIGMQVSIGPVYSLYDDETQGTRHTFFKATTAIKSTAGLGEFFPISTLMTKAFANSAQRQLVERFVREYQTQKFGLYIGSLKTGEVHRDDY